MLSFFHLESSRNRVKQTSIIHCLIIHFQQVDVEVEEAVIEEPVAPKSDQVGDDDDQVVSEEAAPAAPEVEKPVETDLEGTFARENACTDFTIEPIEETEADTTVVDQVDDRFGLGLAFNASMQTSLILTKQSKLVRNLTTL